MSYIIFTFVRPKLTGKSKENATVENFKRKSDSIGFTMVSSDFQCKMVRAICQSTTKPILIRSKVPERKGHYKKYYENIYRKATKKLC